MRIHLAAPGVFVVVGTTVLLLAGCGESSSMLQPAPPVIESATVAAGQYNALSAVVTAQVLGADSVAVRYGVGGGTLDSVTPAQVLPTGSLNLPVLGLLPATAYQMQVVAYGSGSPTLGQMLDLTTGALPADLPAYSAGGSDPSPGFVVFAAGNYGIVIDNTGRVVWYRQLPGGMTLNFQPQPTGHYVTSPVTAAAGDFTPWVEFDPLGAVVRTFGCAGGLKARFHDVILLSDHSYWIMCDDTRQMDLSSVGGVAAAQVTGTVVQHVSAGGVLAFSWSAFDHFAITDLDLQSRTGATVNWTHGNAIDLDPDGNLVVSFRSLSELTKIDVVTGAVRWRMGGLMNQFTFPASELPFTRQHGLRLTGRGRLQLFDNLGQQVGSQAERYDFDEGSHAAHRTAAFSFTPPVTTLLGGSTQTLPSGRILVAYGNGNRVQEYDAGGAVVWEIHGDPGYIFRAERIASLYAPGVGTSR